MPIFNDKRELTTQARRRRYKGTSGFRKGLMNAMTSGWNPMTYVAPAATHMVAEAAAEGDDRDVLQDNRGQAFANQVKAGKLAMNFVPGGALAKVGLGIGADKAIDSLEGTGGGGIDSGDVAAVGGAALASGKGSALVDSIAKQDAMDGAANALDDSVANIDTSEVLSSTTDTFDDIDVVPDADMGLSAAPDVGAVGDAAKVGKKGFMGIGKGGKLGAGISKFQNSGVMRGLGAAAGVASIAGDTAAVIQGGSQYRKGISKDKRRKKAETIANQHYSFA